MKDPVEEATSELKSALAARRGDPATTADEAAGQVRDLRQEISGDIEALRQRIPSTTQLRSSARSTVGKASLAAAAITTAGLGFRRRHRASANKAAAKEQALILARELARLDVQPEDFADDAAGSRSGRWALVIAFLVALVAGAVAARQRLLGDDHIWEQ